MEGLEMEPHGTLVLPNLQFDFALLRPMALCVTSVLIYRWSRHNDN